MKCVKFYRKHGGHVARLTDTDAASEVTAGRAMWAPKNWWKAARAKEQST